MKKLSQKSFAAQQTLEAELYTDGGNDDQAAKIYEKICLESSVEEDEV